MSNFKIMFMFMAIIPWGIVGFNISTWFGLGGLIFQIIGLAGMVVVLLRK